MFREMIMLIGLLLATYGLANLITALVLWFTVPITGKPYVFLIHLHTEDPVRSLILSARERLNNGGLYRSTRLIAVDCGLNPKEIETAKEYCEMEGILLCKPQELQEYLKKDSFQTEENQV